MAGRKESCVEKSACLLPVPQPRSRDPFTYSFAPSWFVLSCTALTKRDEVNHQDIALDCNLWGLSINAWLRLTFA
jgi:hypothetical protein